MVITEYAIEKDGVHEVLHVFCEHEHEVGMCPRCGEISETIHEQEDRCIRHLDIWGKATYVHFPGRRFDCKNCRKPFTENLKWIETTRRESTAYELHIYQQCKHTDQAAVAERENLHSKTVSVIFERWAKRAEKQEQREIVRCLGVD